MQPYQEAGEESLRQKRAPVEALKSAGRTAATVLGGGAALRGGGAILGKIMPFLNNYIPQSLAIAGLSKVDPRIGKFINDALDSGGNWDQVKDFIKDKVGGGQFEKPEGQEPPKQHRNLVEQYSPELHQFMKQEIGRGLNPLKAAGEAQTKVKWHHKFKDVIKKMEKDYKMPWSQIVESTYGNMMDPMVTEKMKDFEMGGQAGMNQPQGQPMQGQTQAGDKWARFDDAVSKINQYLGG